MRNRSVWEHACGLTETVVEGVDFDDASEAIVVSVRPAAKQRGRCGRCRRRSPRYDRGEGRGRWRALDLGTTKVFLEAAAPRVRCRTHGVTVAAVPWAALLRWAQTGQFFTAGPRQSGVRIGQGDLSRSDRIAHFGLRPRPEGTAPAQCNSARPSSRLRPSARSCSPCRRRRRRIGPEPRRSPR